MFALNLYTTDSMPKSQRLMSTVKRSMPGSMTPDGHGHPPRRAALHNLGCKVNSYELDVMAQELRAAGWEIVPFEETAEVYIVNTCTVTGIADRKSRQMLHRAKHTNPEALVVAAGCYVETDRAKLDGDPLVDLCIGNAQKTAIAQILQEVLRERGAGSGPPDPSETAHSEKRTAADSGRKADVPSRGNEDSRSAKAAPQLAAPGRTRADIKIQDGCNMFCTYCIIPYARGRIRSRDPEEVVCEVRTLAQSGVKEVVLTGIHISSYGKEWGRRAAAGTGKDGEGKDGPLREETPDPGRELLQLLTRLQMIAGLRRIRLGSLEPRIITEEFVQGLSRLSKICPHFHLSLQSGCDETLRRMNRHYTVQEYRESVQLLRQYYDRPAITTDIIAGFPGETPEEFEQTVEFVREIGFYQIHVFKYSPRKGTPAVKFPHPCTDSEKTQRSHILLDLTKTQAAAYRRSFFGGQEEILLEDEMEIQGKRYYAGHTTRYIEALVPAQGHCSGEFVSGVLGPGPEGTEYPVLLVQSPPGIE